MQALRPLCLSLALSALAAPALAQDSEFRQCLNGLGPTARASGVSEASFRTHTEALQPLMSVIGNLDAQPEFKTPIWDYLTMLVDPQRVDEGSQRLQEHAELLQRVQQRFGVDPATVVAVWGVESNFGQGIGKTPIVQSLATLSCFGRRQTYFRTEFYASLRLLQAGHFAPERLQGSWAGAFGQTQFMPSTYERLAVDFDGDGRADLIDSIPDALASTANFLQRAGWRNDLPWGFEVQLPANFSAAGEGRRTKRPSAEWAARGLRRVDGSPLPEGMSLGLITPAGVQGPAFLVTRNFDAIYSYNAAESYGLAIAHLADRLRGSGPFATPWPTDDLGLTRAERRELQTLLLAKGHAIGEADGLIGEKTREAVRAEESRLGWPATGRAGQKILKALRGG